MFLILLNVQKTFIFYTVFTKHINLSPICTFRDSKKENTIESRPQRAIRHSRKILAVVKFEREPRIGNAPILRLGACAVQPPELREHLGSLDSD